MRIYFALIPCALLVLLFVFDLDMALRAPVCVGFKELEGWCLPFGWEGPFADFWALRSRDNAITNASLNLGISLLVLGSCVLLTLRRRSSGSPGALIVWLQLGLLLALALKLYALTDLS